MCGAAPDEDRPISTTEPSRRAIPQSHCDQPDLIRSARSSAERMSRHPSLNAVPSSRHDAHIMLRSHG